MSHEFIDGLHEMSLPHVSRVHNIRERSLHLSFVVHSFQSVVHRIKPLSLPETPFIQYWVWSLIYQPLQGSRNRNKLIMSIVLVSLIFIIFINFLILQINWSQPHNCADIDVASKLFCGALYFNIWVPFDYPAKSDRPSWILRVDVLWKYKKSRNQSEFSRYADARSNFATQHYICFKDYLRSCHPHCSYYPKHLF